MIIPTNNGVDADGHEVDGDIRDITLHASDVGRFKSPSLRHVEVAGPYMHDGRLPTLDAVVEHYSRDFHPHPDLDYGVRALNYTESEKAALVAVLKTPTDQAFLADPKFSDPVGVANSTVAAPDAAAHVITRRWRRDAQRCARRQ